MGRLRHRTSPGCTYFVTTDAAQSRHLLQAATIAETIIEKMLAYRDQGAYLLHEFVIMPNHLHLILTPQGDTTLEKALQLIKGGSSFEIGKRLGKRSALWQSGFHEWTIRDVRDYQVRRDYIHLNPVKRALVAQPVVWRFGSACGKYNMDPVPQGLKPLRDEAKAVVVGAKAPTP